MEWLVLGLVIWCGVHLSLSMSVNLKVDGIAKMGENGFKGTFSILVLLGLALIIVGWRSSVPTFLYVLPPITKPIAMLLILFAFISFSASMVPTRLKHFIRHPQLTGVALWATGHLMLNGDSRALVLFGTLGVWALLEMVLINRRDGAWVKPAVPSWLAEAKLLILGVGLYVAVIFLHPYIAGVPVR